MKYPKLFLLLGLATAALTSCISTQTETDPVVPPQDLYVSIADSLLYRIPAIACTQNGNLVAIADNRHGHGNDVGHAMPIDIMYRVSQDQGLTWSPAAILADSQDSTYAKTMYGYGDAAIVADRESDRQMLICVGDSTGRTCFEQGFQQVIRFYGDQQGQHWGPGVNITDRIYRLVPGLESLFIGSGKIHQSRYVKKGQYYRLYCSLISIGYGNAVIYSDDFGETWELLGSTESCCPHGDEPKVDELPDGCVLLSSRAHGRWFNIFRFDDATYTTGHWEEPVLSSSIVCLENACNGEILTVPVIAQATDSVSGLKKGERALLYLQSVPYGPKRSHVSIWFKALREGIDCNAITPTSFGEGWQRHEVTSESSAYSTGCLTSKGRIAFLYERQDEGRPWHDIHFESLSVDSITGGIFSYKTSDK